MSLNKSFVAKNQAEVLAKINNPRLEQVYDFLNDYPVSNIKAHINSVGNLVGFEFQIPSSLYTFYLKDEGHSFYMRVAWWSKQNYYNSLKDIQSIKIILDSYKNLASQMNETRAKKVLR